MGSDAQLPRMVCLRLNTVRPPSTTPQR